MGHHLRKGADDVRRVGPSLIEVAPHFSPNAERREQVARPVRPRRFASIFHNASWHPASDAGTHRANRSPIALLISNKAVGTRGALAFGMTKLAIREDELPYAYHLPLASLRHTSCSSVVMRRSLGNASSRSC